MGSGPGTPRRGTIRKVAPYAFAAIAALALIYSGASGYILSRLLHEGHRLSGRPEAGMSPERILLDAYNGAGGKLTLLAAGDIAHCHDENPGANMAARTAALAAEWPRAPVLALGDLAYSSGTPAEFENCFDPLWGGLKSRTLPTPGNHEYKTLGAYGYFDYWGRQAGPERRGYYSARVGDWLLLSLNSEVAADPASDQGRWLEEALSEAPDACVIAFYHKPAWSLRARDQHDNAVLLFGRLREGGASLVLNGHNHFYERTKPLGANGDIDESDGTVAFTVGTGGKDTSRSYDVTVESAKAIFGHTGLLRIELRDDGYSWWFHDAETKAVLDEGSAGCNPRTEAS